MSVTPSSAVASASLNFQLTNYAQGLWNDLTDVVAIANRLAPPTPVPGASGQYKEFNDKNSFRPKKTKRAFGGDPTVIGFEAGDKTYNCSPHALEVRVDKVEDQQAGAIDGNPQNALISQLLDQGKISALMNTTALSHAFDVCDYVLSNTTAIALRGKWSDVDIDPIDQINEQLLGISLDVGSTKNVKVTMELGVWNTLRSHPKLKSRLIGVQVESISIAQLNSLLIFPCDIQVGNIVYDDAAIGQAANKKRMLSGEFFIHYSVPNATVYDPSAFKCFTVGQQSFIAGVRTYYAPNMLWRGHLMDWSRDIRLTSALSIRRLTIT
jgi:hypothetical protein